MDFPTDSLLKDAIAAEAGKGRQTVTTFVSGVEQRVHECVAVLQKECADDARAVGGAAMDRVRSYAAAKRSLLDPSYEVGATEEGGAAAWYEPDAGRTVFSFSVMDPAADRGYWQRVRRHEEVHHGQAHTFNGSRLVVGSEKIDVLPVLTEGQATQHQPSSDLTPDYRCYQQTYRRLASLLGSRAPLDQAVERGEVKELQESIDVLLIPKARSS